MALCLATSSTLVFAVAGAASAEQLQSAQPTISLEPSSGLSDGDTVTVTGTGFSPSADIGIAMCAAVVSSGENCDYSGAQVATSDASGGFTKGFQVVGSITTPADGTIECAPDGCGIGAANLAVQTEVASTSLSFEESTSTSDEASAAESESDDSDDADDTEESAASTSDDDDGANPIVPITVGVVVVAAGFFVFRRVRQSPADSKSGS